MVGFTATPSDHTLARFGEFNKYAEAEKIWVPFDSYTMREAIEDGYILNPIKGVVPVPAKMYFEIPENELEGFENDFGYDEIPDNTDTGIDKEGKKYAIRKKKIYENKERIEHYSKFIAERLVSSVYHNIRGTAKAMLATASIKAAILYKGFIEKYYKELVKNKKYERFANAPIYIVYSDSQENKISCSSLNGGLSEKTVLQNFKLAKNGIIIVVDKLQTGFDEPKLHTLFLDKEIKGINAIQTISRVNRTTKYKNDCKIVDFSYKSVNVKNIKEAFEHFSNVVVSDFDPLGDEEKLVELFKTLSTNSLFKTHFQAFKSYHISKDINLIIGIDEAFEAFIKNSKADAKKIKEEVSRYFYNLNLIEFVIDLDPKYSEELFIEFWRKYNMLYNQINKQSEVVNDVEIYFDNKIGIIAPIEPDGKVKKPKNPSATDAAQSNKYKYDILKVIEKRNQEEEEIEELITEFEKKISSFFDFIKTDDNGQRLIAKIKDEGSVFSQDEIYSDFTRIYRKYTIKNKDLGDFFVRETKDILNQLCDDFEKSLKKNYPIGEDNSDLLLVAEP